MTEPVTDDELKKLYKEEHEDRIHDMADILRTGSGKRYIWWLLETCHMFSSTFTGNSMSAFLEGERNVGLRIFKDILKVDAKLMGQLAQSHAAKRKQLQEKKDKALKRGMKKEAR